jgi:hypothetical protein
MSHFARVENGIVQDVIVAEQDFIDSGALAGTWIQTSYNTFGGQHLLGGTPLRKNFAGVGMAYDSKRDAFYHQKPFASWVLDEQSCMWQPPFPAPENGGIWDEETLSWKTI